MPSESTRKIDDLPGKRLFVAGRLPVTALSCSRLAEHPASPSLGDAQLGPNNGDVTGSGRARSAPKRLPSHAKKPAGRPIWTPNGVPAKNI